MIRSSIVNIFLEKNRFVSFLVELNPSEQELSEHDPSEYESSSQEPSEYESTQQGLSEQEPSKQESSFQHKSSEQTENSIYKNVAIEMNKKLKFKSLKRKNSTELDTVCCCPVKKFKVSDEVEIDVAVFTVKGE